MAKLKMLKLPKRPKAPSKPSASASLSSKQAYLRRVKDIRDKYYAKCKEVQKENAHRDKTNKESERLSKVISGIEVFPSSFTAKNIRLPRPGGHVSGLKKRKKSAHKKTAHKKTARKTARRKRR